jgi:hypothetical protein
LLTAPRGLTQPTTSFIGSWRQGIPRTPFLAQRCTPSVRTPSRQDRINILVAPIPCRDCSPASMGSMSITLQLLRCPRAPAGAHVSRNPTKNGLAPARPLVFRRPLPGQGPLSVPLLLTCLQWMLPCRLAATVLYTPSPPRLQPAGPPSGDRLLSLTRDWILGVGVPGLEPGTSVLSGLRSNQLS